MKSTLILLIFCLIGFSQSEKPNYKTASKLFLTHFNNSEDEKDI